MIPINVAFPVLLYPLTSLERLNLDAWRDVIHLRSSAEGAAGQQGSVALGSVHYCAALPLLYTTPQKVKSAAGLMLNGRGGIELGCTWDS